MPRYEPDIRLIGDALNALVSQAVLEGTLHGRDGRAIDSDALHEQASEVFRILLDEFGESAAS